MLLPNAFACLKRVCCFVSIRFDIVWVHTCLRANQLRCPSPFLLPSPIFPLCLLHQFPGAHLFSLAFQLIESILRISRFNRRNTQFSRWEFFFMGQFFSQFFAFCCHPLLPSLYIVHKKTFEFEVMFTSRSTQLYVVATHGGARFYKMMIFFPFQPADGNQFQHFIIGLNHPIQISQSINSWNWLDPCNFCCGPSIWSGKRPRLKISVYPVVVPLHVLHHDVNPSHSPDPSLRSLI